MPSRPAPTANQGFRRPKAARTASSTNLGEARPDVAQIRPALPKTHSDGSGAEIDNREGFRSETKLPRVYGSVIAGSQNRDARA